MLIGCNLGASERELYRALFKALFDGLHLGSGHIQVNQTLVGEAGHARHHLRQLACSLDPFVISITRCDKLAALYAERDSVGWFQQAECPREDEAGMRSLIWLPSAYDILRINLRFGK